jgi:iron only hydrogenase large subunit-like protein
MKSTILTVLAVVAGIVVFFGLIFGIWGGVKSFSRAQRLADERNQTQVNDIQIAQTAQLVKVQQQKAQIQIAQAYGIAKAQDIIKSTLTPAYLQYEAIEAQKDEINSPNHTIIYIPSGQNGLPLVNTVPQQ